MTFEKRVVTARAVNDERVQEDNMGPWAYGPFYVHKLAQRSLNNGGGATRASTNADSYAVLANSKSRFLTLETYVCHHLISGAAEISGPLATSPQTNAFSVCRSHLWTVV